MIFKKYYSGDWRNALVELFPDVHFDKTKLISSFGIIFPNFKRNFVNIFLVDYGDKQNRVSFFQKFASKRSFDPLVANNWHSISSREVAATKVINNIPYFYVVLFF